MQLTIGQKVAYPNQGVCLVESFKEFILGTRSMPGFSLRVLGDNSTIFVPLENADTVGIRPLISSTQCEKLIDMLSDDFEPVSGDWKTRSREFTEKLRTGDIFQTAEVFKMLTFLSHEKKLSFREQSLLEKSKFLIVSEITNADQKKQDVMESDVCRLVESACVKHRLLVQADLSAAAH